MTGSVANPIAVTKPAGCIGEDTTANLKVLASMGPVLQQATERAAIDLSDSTAVYLIPASFMCGGRGPKGVASPRNSRILLYGDKCEDVRVSAHEYGHILGVDHASIILPNGDLGDVGDATDVMGFGLFPPNGPHRTQLGWIPEGKALAVSASGSFHLAPLGDDTSSAPQLLVLTRPDDPSKAIYISFRRAEGPDAALSADDRERTSIHEFSATCPTGESQKTLLLATVPDGGEYTVAGASMGIRQLSHDQAGALVEVTIGR